MEFKEVCEELGVSGELYYNLVNKVEGAKAAFGDSYADVQSMLDSFIDYTVYKRYTAR